MNYSTEQAARIVQVLSFILPFFKVDIGPLGDDFTNVVAAALFVCATAYGWYKRWAKGDLKLLGGRKWK